MEFEGQIVRASSLEDAFNRLFENINQECGSGLTPSNIADLARKTADNYHQFIANVEWFNQHYKAIRKGHGNQIIGILDRQVWFSSEDPQEFRERLQAEPRMHQVYINFVPKIGTILLPG